MENQNEKNEKPPLIDSGKSLVKTAKDVLVGFFKSGVILADSDRQNHRLRTCVSCEHCNDNMTCSLCGCGLHKKSALRYATCPARKW